MRKKIAEGNAFWWVVMELITFTAVKKPMVIDLKITENDDNTDNFEVIMGSEVIMIR